MALMEWEAATVKADVESAAAPPLTGAVPRTTDPFRNCTLPVGVPDPECPMVAVNFTDWPNSDGLAEDANVVVVALAITSVSEVVLPVKYVAPL